MANIDLLKRIPLPYHFTGRRNLRSFGRTADSTYDRTHTEEDRNPPPGGNEWGQDSDGLKSTDAYVHLCFRNNYPMEYLARQEGKIAFASTSAVLQ